MSSNKGISIAIKRNITPIALLAVFILILIGASLSFYNNRIIQKAIITKELAEITKRETENMFLNIRNMDISSRGYAIMQEDRFLFLPVDEARVVNQKNFKVLDSLFALQGYNDPQNYTAVKEGFTKYADLYANMVTHLKSGDVDGYKALLAQDYGKQFWTTNEKFSSKLYAYEDNLKETAQADFDAAVLRNNTLQFLLILIGIPSLGAALFQLRKESKKRTALLLGLEENNRKYLFNSGAQSSGDAKEILENSINNLKKASHFVNQISEGNYQVRWEDLTEANMPLNQNNLAGRLVQMRDQMIKVKLEDDKRLWTTEGLSTFSETIRNHQSNLAELSQQALTFLVKYLKAQQGSLFILETPDTGSPYLKLEACYAFNRKKYIEKQVEPGEGLIGQAYLEGETVMLKEVPQGYVNITSGLGESAPGCILIVPMKYNEKVQAIIEVASFDPYEEYQVAFLEKAGEFVASAIATAQINSKTQVLLAQMQEQTEHMRAQEEELRQNMEELEATQEEMRRKETELELRLANLNTKQD
jgi:putative methionine-R-sulfoxide reductase with GAF domain